MMVKQFELLNDACALGEIYYKNRHFWLTNTPHFLTKINSTEEKCECENVSYHHILLHRFSHSHNFHEANYFLKRRICIETDSDQTIVATRNNFWRETNVMHTIVNLKAIRNTHRKPF